MNYLVGFLGMLIFGIFYKNGSIPGIWFYYLAVINIGLGTFNLIPVPPLDGSNVLQELLPGVGRFYARIRRYAPLILVICLATGILWTPLSYANAGILNGMWKLVRRILRIGFLPPGPPALICKDSRTESGWVFKKERKYCVPFSQRPEL